MFIKTHQRVMQMHGSVLYRNTKDASIENCKQLILIALSEFDR